MLLFPYKPASESAKALANALGIKRISHRNSRFKGSPEKSIINWGASEVPAELLKCKVYNHPDAVSAASNKLKFFERMAPVFVVADRNTMIRSIIHMGTVWVAPDHDYVVGLKVGDVCHRDDKWVVAKIVGRELGVELPRVPMHTTEVAQAYSWLEDGHCVVARTILTGNSGAGIVMLDSDSLGQPTVKAPLYVIYVPKKQEYRVHVLAGEVVDIQRKARRKDIADEDINWKIRNHDNGFIFARGVGLGEVPVDVLKQSLLTLSACGLDFGAVDVIFNEKDGKAYVLEVNTAPGLSGSTLDGYAERFRELM